MSIKKDFMPKTLDYPLATFRNSMEIADAVDALGGSCSIESCAHKLDRQPTSGGYKMVISSAVKYGLIVSNRGTLTVTSDYKLQKLAYSDEERLDIQRKLFLRPEVFASLYNRFNGKPLPLSMLDKLMIREMNVDENTASRVSGYFVKGLKEMGLLGDGDIVLPITKEVVNEDFNKEKDNTEKSSTNQLQQPTPDLTFASINSNVFTVSITGPGVNNTFQILEEEDLEWVEVAIKKIKRALKAAEIKNEGAN